MTTEQNVENFVNNDDFATVFNSESFMPELGLNTFSFSAPYQWDGVSNIILEFCHGDDASFATMSREIVADGTNFISTIKFAESIAVTGSESCSNTTENKSTYSTVITRLLFNYKYLLSIKVNVQIFRIQAVGNYWET